MIEKQATILIVDDEETIRRLLEQKLSSQGYHCYKAGNADQALEKLRHQVIDLVILDIKMPGRSGVQVLPEIRASYPDTAVIMATAITDAGAAIQCMKQGAYDYVTKPFNLDEVALSIDRALERRRLELENRDYQQHLERKVAEQANKIRAAFLNAITALAHALEAKGRYTSGHSQRVAETSVAIAQELGIPHDAIERIRLAGLVHDIGKIGVREAILNKTASLADEESLHVKRHCEIGEHILNPVVDDKEILLMVRHHHERYDGHGYPDGLRGEQIPLGARILAIADAYDAMTSERPYRAALDTEVACLETEHHKGTQFDPQVADAFLRSRRSNVSTYRSQSGNG
jgi:putative two-component system response regulator